MKEVTALDITILSPIPVNDLIKILKKNCLSNVKRVYLKDTPEEIAKKFRKIQAVHKDIKYIFTSDEVMYFTTCIRRINGKYV